MPQYAILKIIFNSCRFSLGNLHIKLLFHISEMKRVLLLMSSLLIVVSAQHCRTTYSTKVRYLKGHVISTHNVKDHGHCLILCSENQRCRSTNFQLRNLACELNDADRHTHPWDYSLKMATPTVIMLPRLASEVMFVCSLLKYGCLIRPVIPTVFIGYSRSRAYVLKSALQRFQIPLFSVNQ